jgi:superoxide dismutase, Cu-Zn family
MARSTQFLAASVLLLGFAAACATPPVFVPREWNATLTGQGAHAGARATARAVTGIAQTAIAITLTGGESGGTHPWHVHSGSCGSGGGIVGDPGAYPPLRPGTGGNASATARIALELMAGQTYHVNIHRSATDLGTIVACGELR